MSIFRPTFVKVALLLVVGIFLNLGYLAYLRYWPVKGVEINNSPVPVLNSPIKAGDVLAYEVDYCRYTDVPSYFTRTLQGPALITIAQGSGKGEKGCHKTRIQNTTIPTYTPSGKYFLSVDICNRLTPLQNKCSHYQTQEFQVIGGDK